MMLWKQFRWRKGLLSALDQFDLGQPARTADSLEPVLASLAELKSGTSGPQTVVVESLEYLISSVADLCRWLARTLTGDALASAARDSAGAKAAIVVAKIRDSKFADFSGDASALASAVAQVSAVEQVGAVVEGLKKLKAPVFLVDFQHANRPVMGSVTPEAEPGDKESSERDVGPFVVKVMMEIDRKPWSNPQIIRAQTLYDVSARVSIGKWPMKTDHLLIDTVSTLDPTDYSMTLLRIDRAAGGTESVAGGHVSFHIPQSLLSEPIRILARATFLSSADRTICVSATVIGYHELRVRVSDPRTIRLLARYRALDARIVDLLDEIDRNLPKLDADHREDFIGALGAVANYAGVCAQQALYRESDAVTESSFRADLLRHMRGILGEDVQEAPAQAGGPTDVVYRSIAVELKVEKRIADRRKMISHYLNQPTQYSSGTGSQLSILCILDITPKRNPPASPSNNLSLETPELHGFPGGTAPFPSRVAALVIDGNLRRPSDYSG